MKFNDYKQESQHLELKKELTDKLEKEVVSFLNSKEGGVVIIGIDDGGCVFGLDNADKLQLQIKDKLKHNITPSTMGLFDVVLEQIDNKTIIKIIIASGSEKPYYLAKMGMSSKGCFIRIGSASEPMTSEMVETLFATRVRNSIGNIASRYQDLNFEQLRIYYQEKGYSLNEQFANNLELLTKNKEYNYAGYLLADKNGSSIKIGKYSGADRIDLIENKEFGHCCLVKATKSVLDKLNVENRTFTQITAKERVERKMLDPIALREAVINAIIHNDYSNEIPPKFELFSDRLEITSAGKLPDGFSQEEFFEGYSIPRNKELMRIFRDLDMVEQMGSGITRILNAYPQSIYKFTANFIRITLPFTKGFVEYYANTTQADPQVTPQAKVLDFCQESKTRNEIQEYLGLKDREHFRKTILNPLLESGQIAMTIPDKPTSPNQKFYTTNSDGSKNNE
ncbi:putative DNA binding domain-containing protein [Francisellaceae bacterium CB299]